MLGLIILISICVFIYRSYAEMAFEFNKSRTGFGILGIGIFVVMYFISAFTLGVVLALTGNMPEDELTLTFLGEGVAIAGGALAVWITYSLIKRSWSKTRADYELLDSNK